MISCNMVLNVQMPDDLMRGKKRSFSRPDLFKSWKRLVKSSFPIWCFKVFATCCFGNFQLLL